MATQELLTEEEEQQIIAAINKTEQKTTGEVRVHIQKQCNGNALEHAARIFHDLGMDATKRKNGVLIYIAFEDHKAAVYAGKGIDKQVQEGYWNDVLNILLTHFKKDEFAKGIQEAISEVAGKLAELYPYEHDDIDELTNEISYQDN
ncbi:TLP18.3, Psb32 and MOLO-1 founding protein of phosphatase [Fodinibius salinus]|uniref:TLP18.3, Psb32 and MOLO-1 founding protein of phosphatase n=1 Tax=Fodinibius salinus TaxID=860790 RepID=A0A5D3YJ43_9BACT|nr:TPM domain-containing protein [Fodinibius salinus]TYP92755.1 TLP18.3, Psb32 and MOLO-1 founding protein of phosphatase [Fodinibius salinus]